MQNKLQKVLMPEKCTNFKRLLKDSRQGSSVLLRSFKMGSDGVHTPWPQGQITLFRISICLSLVELAELWRLSKPCILLYILTAFYQCLHYVETWQMINYHNGTHKATCKSHIFLYLILTKWNYFLGLWVKHACLSATLRMPSLESTSQQCK